ncbi:hypothetical protein BT67DRAFT_489982 [Trichocladium antarcticum]|uniref:Uncharacterized protein n=1 Tax=Trichocladium antarcticum TaxID=1450529 RepID=A0AAN6UFB8_9PEZI|nr:hypothetical protein BT67DRAFT_489982 [Trichocladium antarcticum]
MFLPFLPREIPGLRLTAHIACREIAPPAAFQLLVYSIFVHLLFLVVVYWFVNSSRRVQLQVRTEPGTASRCLSAASPTPRRSLCITGRAGRRIHVCLCRGLTSALRLIFNPDDGS